MTDRLHVHLHVHSVFTVAFHIVVYCILAQHSLLLCCDTRERSDERQREEGLDCLCGGVVLGRVCVCGGGCCIVAGGIVKVTFHHCGVRARAWCGREWLRRREESRIVRRERRREDTHKEAQGRRERHTSQIEAR